MSTWSVYGIQGLVGPGTTNTVDKDDKAATAWLVRWRVDGVQKKRRFASKGHVKTFQQQLVRASVMGWDADANGRPIDPTRSTGTVPHVGSRTAVPASAAPAWTFATYCNDVWWPTMKSTFEDKNRLSHRRNMRLAIDLVTYRYADPRCAGSVPGGVPGGSILLHHLNPDDLRLAMVARAGRNDRTAAVNKRRLAAALATGITDVVLLAETSSAATVRSFYITVAMIVNAAKRSGHTIGDPPAGVSRVAPTPKPTRFVDRMLPSLDEIFDLADVMSTLGPIENGRHRGDRFRALILAAGTLGPRPGELVAHRPDLITFSTGDGPAILTFAATEASVYDTETDLRGRRLKSLKHRAVGETRTVPVLIPKVADALTAHLDRGYAGRDRTFTSSTGRGRLDWGNIKDVFWKPACERVFAGTAKAALAEMPPKTLRSAAVSLWLDAGVSRHLAAAWAGHSTEVADLYYAGRVNTEYTREMKMLADYAAGYARMSGDETRVEGA